MLLPARVAPSAAFCRLFMRAQVLKPLVHAPPIALPQFRSAGAHTAHAQVLRTSNKCCAHASVGSSARQLSPGRARRPLPTGLHHTLHTWCFLPRSRCYACGHHKATQRHIFTQSTPTHNTWYAPGPAHPPTLPPSHQPPATLRTSACHSLCPGDASAVSASYARRLHGPCRGNKPDDGAQGRGFDTASPAPTHHCTPPCPDAQKTPLRPWARAKRTRMRHISTNLVRSATFFGIAAGWPMPRGCTPGNRSSVSWSWRGCQSNDCRTQDAQGISTANGSAC